MFYGGGEKEMEMTGEQKIKYFVNGFNKVFYAKQEAIKYAKELGVDRSRVSMIVPPELMKRIVHKEN